MVLARAITLIESSLPRTREKAAHLLDALLPHTGKSRRVGITGVPGVGKSTFIDALGMHLTARTRRTCSQSSASILRAPSRAAAFSATRRAWSGWRWTSAPSSGRRRRGGHLGGVARRTRETILLCEAAGFRNVFIETVGVGQSETAVRSMSDFFLLLMLAGAGDELQGIKRGIIEMIDGMAINKADGDNQTKAERARVEYASALHLFPASPRRMDAARLCCSALKNTGIAEIWQMVLEHEAQLTRFGLDRAAADAGRADHGWTTLSPRAWRKVSGAAHGCRAASRAAERGS